MFWAAMLPVTSNGRSWWQWWRVVLAALIATAIVMAAFVYQFNTPEGSLGGFTNDHFAHLMRTEMLLRGEQPLRDFADAELRGAWPALSYAVPAWAQQIGGRTLLSEAYLTLGALAIAHAIVFLFALGLSERWSVALLATAVAIFTAPRAYSYPKVLMLALGAVALRSAMSKPCAFRLGLAAVVTVAATLFRHDLGVYVAAGVIAGLIARDAGAWSLVARRIGLYTGFTAMCLVPSAVWVQVYEGIPSYVRNALSTAAREAERTKLELPTLEASVLLTGDGLVALTYYAFWMVLVAAAVVLASRAFGALPLSAKDRATAVGLLAMAALVNYFLMRGSLSGRLGDAVIPVVLLAAWITGAAAPITSTAARRLVTLLPVTLLLFMFGTLWVSGGVARKLEASGLTDSWETVAGQFVLFRDNLRRLPPVNWSEAGADGGPLAARYVAECTSSDDYLLVAGEAPEIHVFARRRFAAGQGTMGMGLYTSDADQRRALARLARQSVPIILADVNFESEFAQYYRLLGWYIGDHYREAGTILVDEEPRFRVFVEADRQPRGVDAHFGLPCFR